MKLLESRRNRKGGIHRAFRWFVRLIVGTVLLLLAFLLYLRINGVPNPVLQELIRRANEAGIPVELDAIKPSLYGWRAENVRYYSRNADDLIPIIQADQVYFSRISPRSSPEQDQWKFSIQAEGVRMSPSIEWGVEIPEESVFRSIGRAELSVAFKPDSIEISNGLLNWMDVRFLVDGVIIKRKGEPSPKPPDQIQTLFPVYISGQYIQRLEQWLQTLSFDGPADMQVRFSVDSNDYRKSWIECVAEAEEMRFRDVSFSGAGMKLRYHYPRIDLPHCRLTKDNQSIGVDGWYDLDENIAEIRFFNSISSPRMLLLLPRILMSEVNRAGLQFKQLPDVDLRFGPSAPLSLTERVSGLFSVRDVAFRNVEVVSLTGSVVRQNGQLELENLEGEIRGQEQRSSLTGSGMTGGPVSGKVFWDSSGHTFGVTAETELDPNLLLETLSFSRVAADVIGRFKFSERPPHGVISLGASYDDWKSFYLEIHASGSDVRLQEVPFSSLSATARYRNGILDLDQVVARQEREYLKGSASIDFYRDEVSFDAIGTLSPRTVQDVVCPGVDVFGRFIRDSGSRRIKAVGVVDWRKMQTTAFEAEVQIERVELPFAALDGFSSVITAKGPLVTFSDATFGIYDGAGKGTLSMKLDPAGDGIPYETSISVERADFRKCIEYIRENSGFDVKGTLNLRTSIQADLLRGFFATANGNGAISVSDGQLADLPLFSGFSKVMRKLIPSFRFFSINRATADFKLEDGVVSSDNAYFDGDLLSAKGQGSYSRVEGFDALVQVQILSDNRMNRLFRWITDPIFKFFELRLEGTLSDPVWHVEKFSNNKRFSQLTGKDGESR